MGKETGTTFPISVQDKEVNALLDMGAEKNCMSMDMFARLKLPLNVANKVKKCIRERHENAWSDDSEV